MVNEGDIKCVHDADDFDPDPHHSAREPSDDSNLEDVSGEKATDLTTSTIFEHPNRDTFPAGKDGYSQYWLECIRVWRDVLLYCIRKLTWNDLSGVFIRRVLTYHSEGLPRHRR